MKRILWLLAILMLVPGNNLAKAEDMTMKSADDFASLYYQNPSMLVDIGDPFIVQAEDAYWHISTSSPSGFLLWRSEDLVTWVPQPKPAYKMSKDTWGDAQFWAPELYAYQGRYFLFYSAKQKRSTSLRIGVAASDLVSGPYVDITDGPLFDPGYSVIDASLFVDDDGQPYLYYSRDCSENIVDGVHESDVYGVRLLPDLNGIDGEPVLLTRPDQDWELASGPEWLWNEGPILRKHQGKYWLFYSANFYAGKEYGVGAACADSPLGPFEKQPNNPLLTYTDQGGETLISGPGHNSFLELGDELFAVYHTHHFPIAPSGDRQMALDRAGFHADGTPYINGPTLAPQLRPLSQLGLRNVAPLASLQGSAPDQLAFLTDGDYGISPASAAYTWRPEGPGARAEFTWTDPAHLQALLIYPAPGAKGTGRAVINGNQEIQLNFDALDAMPGACLRLHFDPVDVRTLRIELDQPSGGLCEVIALGD